jgi:hypothetical protein
MDSVTSTRVVHYFDVALRRILCGVHGSDHRSTKHSRSVTCGACIGLLGTRPAEDNARAAPHATVGGAASMGASRATMPVQ